MELELTDEQEMLREATRAFVEAESPLARVRELWDDPAGFDRASWRKAADLGWCGLVVPERLGGTGVAGEEVVDVAVVAEELGRLVHPGPFLSVSVVADALAAFGTDEQQRAHLPGLLGGETVPAWAMAEDDGSCALGSVRTTAVPDGDGFRLDGAKRAVQDGPLADLLLVTARGGGDSFVQLLVPAATAGVTVVPLATADLGRRLADVELDGVRVPADAVLGEPSRTARQVERQLRLAVVLQCAETVGAVDRLLGLTIEYAKDRVAFGRPIGSFQAVKHALADAATWLEAAQAATWHAVHAVQAARSAENAADDDAADAHDVDLAAGKAARIAKAFVGAHCPRIVEACMQVHGGIAMTWEHDSHLYLRRARSNEALHGSPAWHADELCTLLGMGGR